MVHIVLPRKVGLVHLSFGVTCFSYFVPSPQDAGEVITSRKSRLDAMTISRK